MNVLFLLFVIAILLVLIFWELSKINSLLKRTLVTHQDIKKDTNLSNVENPRPKV